ncbi:MAG: hypothetical protein HKN44_12860 [Ilumatobacter sp.]|nr:hypothetical protein [Ilumatobacter sp.]
MLTGELSSVDGTDYYRISGVEHMEPFLMTVVSDTDLWMFVSSTGALTAGRVDADHALFPYETDDRVHRAAGLAGPVTVIARVVDGRREIWRPFWSERTVSCTRAIEKSVLGDRVVFEEHNERWGLRFRATWAPSDAHGWVRTVEVVDLNSSGAELEVLDGLLDVMPSGVDAHTEQIRSNLVDAYKRSETGPWGSLAVYTLESLITDRAEPAEALTATTVWASGWTDARVDLDARSVAAMAEGRPSAGYHLLTGRAGAYLLRGAVAVPAAGAVSWSMVCDTGLAHGDVVALAHLAHDPDAATTLHEDIEAGSWRLRELLAGADAFQSTADPIADAHHASNVLFNSMRGGVFPYGHEVPVGDLVDFVHERNHEVAARSEDWLRARAPQVDAADLRADALANGDADLVRLVLEYLPLTFSRRHGDPSRPWNRFSINVRDDGGRELLSYEGNWRDIFQNWEALLRSYPAYHVNVVAKFVNASTPDGYNPYRLSRAGIDWEVPDPDDPWSHIGYWGDHQIIYLLRLLEAWDHHEPGAMCKWFDRSVFVYADVPYTIADHDAIVSDPRSTITYDEQKAAAIDARERRLGPDGRLVVAGDGRLVRVGLGEKLLVAALAKLSNFVPGGGIWLNTQRPEWNDANNALAGPGLSMVTLYHLRRYLQFLDDRLAALDIDDLAMSASVAVWLTDIAAALDELASRAGPLDDHARRTAVDALGRAAERHRARALKGIDPATVPVRVGDVRGLCTRAGQLLDDSIRDARRDDGLFHSYNRLSFPANDTARVDELGAMLEGQVAVLTSGTLDAVESRDLIDALFSSGMYRADQQSFMLYPVVQLPSFLDRNLVPDDAVARLADVRAASLPAIFATDPDGGLRFRPEAVNAVALAELLDAADVDGSERSTISAVYERVFEHASFTGRSAGMYGYEGIGSVYWHMVAKLLLAVQETYWSAIDADAPDDQVDGLADAYRRVRAGLGFRKGPAEYGAIPTDCYSHTPAHAGAQQPGMTGQVKEEILTRFGELGVRVVAGRITLSPGLIDPAEVLASDPDGARSRFTLCAVPMTIGAGSADGVAVTGADGTRDERPGLHLTEQQSEALFARNGEIASVDWTLGPATVERWRRQAQAP